MGATTVWERWDSMLPDGTINPGEMTSFNHYALGAVADWMHRSVAGLAPAAPGYREILVRPQPPEQLSFAEARHLTPYGLAAVRWERDGDDLALTVTVPVGANAIVEPPGTDETHRLGHGVHRIAVGSFTRTGASR
jgi:alpha-L-rhamnosidase